MLQNIFFIFCLGLKIMIISYFRAIQMEEFFSGSKYIWWFFWGVYFNDFVVNKFMPTGAFNICCPRDCVSRHNGGASGAPLKPPWVDSALRALSTLRTRLSNDETLKWRDCTSRSTKMIAYLCIFIFIIFWVKIYWMIFFSGLVDFNGFVVPVSSMTRLQFCLQSLSRSTKMIA